MADSVTPPPDEGGAPPNDPQGGGDPEKGNNQLEALKRKLRKAEKEMESLRKAEEDRKTSELSEVDRLKKQVADLAGQLDTERGTAKKALVQARFEQLALKAGAQNPTAAFKLAELADVETADDMPALKAALEKLQKSDGYLFGKPADAPNVGTPGGNPPGGNGKTTFTADQLSAMSAEDFAKADADLKAGRAILK